MFEDARRVAREPVEAHAAHTRWGRTLVRFNVLGELEAIRDGHPLPLGGRRQQLVLAVLLDAVDHRVSVEALVEAVWSHDPPASARKTLQAYVSRLRSLLGGDVIETVDDGYRVASDAHEVDLQRFLDESAAGVQALERDPREASRLLTSALSLWRGVPYGSLGSELALAPSRTRLLDRRIEVLERRIAADLAIGEHVGLVAELDALLADHPLRESLHRLRMRALYAVGRQTEAIESVRELHDLLGEQYGLEVAPATRELQQRMLVHDPSLLSAVTAPERQAPATAGAPGPTASPLPPAESRPGEGPSTFSPDSPPNPYRGLRPFHEAHAGRFHGRDDLVGELVRRTERDPLVVVVGSSGSGKSSAVRAGLVPAIRERHPDWLIASMIPGDRPFDQLEAALRGPQDAPARRPWTPRGDGLDVLRLVLGVVPGDGEVVLVIDQLEELFILPDTATSELFASALVEAIDDPSSRLHVVATIRADFLNRPLQHATFGPLVDPASVLVPPLTPAQLEAATVRPASAVGVGVAPELVAQLVADVANEPAALPLFQYTLTELFEDRAGGPMTLAGYRELGGLQGALAARADDILARLSEDARAATRHVFLRLVTLAEGAEDTRRRVTRAELEALPVRQDVTDAVLEVFGRGRLLVFDRDVTTGAPSVEVAHEALLREWPTLRAWVDDARDELRLHRSLSAATVEWEASGRDPAFLLVGGRLATFDHWGEDGPVALTTDESDLLAASREHRDASAAAEEARRRRQLELERRARGRLRQLVAVLSVAVVVVAGLGVLVAERSRAAVEVREQAAVDAVVDGARQLAASAIAVEDDPERSILLVLHAIRDLRDAGQVVDPDVVAALHWALQAAHVPYEDVDQPRVVDRGDGTRRGLYALDGPALVDHALGATTRQLTTEECRRFLGVDPCPDPLDVTLADGLAIDQPGVPLEPGGLGGTVVVGPSIQGRTTASTEALRSWIEDRSGGVGFVPPLVGDTTGSFGNEALEDADVVMIEAPLAAQARIARGLGALDTSTWVPNADAASAALRTAVGPDDEAATRPGVPLFLHTTGWVWYRPEEFAQLGHDVPRTYPELAALVDRMVAEGRTPWCFGDPSAAGGAGGPAVGVVEALLLAESGPETYLRFAAGDIGLDHPAVRLAVSRYDELILAPGHVEGGRERVARTSPRLVATEYGRGSSDCLMTVGTTIDGWDSRRVGMDVFPLPGRHAETRPVAAGFTWSMVALTDRPEVRAVMAALADPGVVEAWASAGSSEYGFSAHPDFDVEVFAEGDARRTIAEHVRAAAASDGLVAAASSAVPLREGLPFQRAVALVTREGPSVIDEALADAERDRTAGTP